MHATVTIEMYEHIRRSIAAGFSLALLAGMTACFPDAEAPGARRVSVGQSSTAPLKPAQGGRLFPGLKIVSEVRSDSTPIAIDKTFVGSAFPRDGRSRLGFFGFNASGTAWRVETNPSCVGTVPTQVGNEPTIVILDSNARKNGKGPVTTTVATAFSAGGGDVLWGPTEVPGPSPRTGLVFANTPKALTGLRPPATLLDAASGAVVDLAAANGQSGTALYEYRGTALAGTADNFAAIDSGSGKTLWTAAQLDPEGSGAGAGARPLFKGSYGPSTGGVVVLDWTSPDGSTVKIIHSIRTGAPLGPVNGTAAGMATADYTSQIVLLTSRGKDGTYSITAVHPQKGVLWTTESWRQAMVASMGGGAAYAQLNGKATRMALDSGTVLAAGDYNLPVAVLADGTALFPTHQPEVYAVAIPRPST